MTRAEPPTNHLTATGFLMAYRWVFAAKNHIFFTYILNAIMTDYQLQYDCIYENEIASTMRQVCEKK